MALDTENKRRSASNHLLLNTPPSPNLKIGSGDRANVGGVYSGFVFPTGLLPSTTTGFGREPTLLISLEVTGDLVGSQTFLFSPKDGRPLNLLLNKDVRPYLLAAGGRPTRIQPDKGATERGSMTITFTEDPEAPDFDSTVFSIFKGGGFWRRLIIAQPDYIGSLVEIKRGFIVAGVQEGDFERIFKGRLEEIDIQIDSTVSLVVKDDLNFNDREAPKQISDDNLVDGAILATDSTFAVDRGSEITDPATLDSKDFFPVIVRIDPGGTEEDIIISSISASVVTVQANFLNRSEEFDNATWVKSAGITVVANDGVGPFGGEARADIIKFPLVGDFIEQDSGETGGAGQDFVFSVWLKATTESSPPLNMTIEVSKDDDSVSKKATVEVTDSWARHEVFENFSSTENIVGRIRRDAGDGAEVLALGAQLEKANARGFYSATVTNKGADAGRGAFVSSGDPGSSAAAHADNDAFREIIPYRLQILPESGVHPIVIIRDLVNRAEIAVVDVDQSTFDREFNFIQSSQLKRAGTTVIDRPETLSKHVSEVRQQALIDLWVSELGLVKVRLSFRQNIPGVTSKAITDSDNSIFRKSGYKNNAESRVTTSALHYNPIIGSEANKPADFLNHQVNIDPETIDKSGPRTKSIFSKWIFRSAEATALTGRIISRFRRGARIAMQELDLKDEGDFFVGDLVAITSKDVLKRGAGGQAVQGSTQWQVVHKMHNRQAGTINFEALEFSGRRYAIISPSEDLETPPDVFPDFPAASEAERQFGFIGDSANLVNAGTEDGYYIL